VTQPQQNVGLPQDLPGSAISALHPKPAPPLPEVQPRFYETRYLLRNWRDGRLSSAIESFPTQNLGYEAATERARQLGCEARFLSWRDDPNMIPAGTPDLVLLVEQRTLNGQIIHEEDGFKAKGSYQF